MKYATVSIRYHWLSAVLIVVLFGSGLAYSYDWAGDGALNLHQLSGQALIAVLVLRIIARLRHPVPVDSPPYGEWARRAAHVVHGSLYFCMIAYLATGYIAASALGDNLLVLPANIAFARSDMGEQLLDLHFTLKWVLLGLVTLHVAGALKHLLWDKDSTFANMIRNR